MEYVIVLVLIALSALFSGLTLGLLSLDVHTVKRQAESGNRDAERVYPIRRQGNLLLSTLLLGNVAVNASLSVFLGTIASGVVAGIVATAAIFVFGEIIPQAVISRHALWFGARTAWFVRVAILIFYPVTFPIACLLDKLLGEELPTIYSTHELMQIISEHEDSEHSQIDQDEERIVHGALQFSHRRVEEVMTKKKDVASFAVSDVMDESLREKIADLGYSRFPVYKDNKNTIVGILYAKDLLIEDEHVTIGDAEEAFEDSYLVARPHEFLDVTLARMLKSKQHICIVQTAERTLLGLITLEDIIEEIIQHEIEDEDDD